jgi:DNA polymerase-3 subunit delta
MQLVYDDIKAGRLKPVYLFCGDEAWLMEEALQALTQYLAPSGEAWNLEILDGGAAGPDAATAAAQEGSLFGASRLVIVKDINWLAASGKASAAKGGDKDATAPLLAYLDAPNPDTCLVLTARGNVDKRRKLVQAIQKKGRLIECATPKGGERDMWLAGRFKATGLKADRRAIAHISVSCANLSQMAAEADKLILYCADKGEITFKDALDLVAESSLLTVFELTDAAAAKNAAKACACLRRLLRQGEEEQKIFALLAAQFRNILLSQDLQQRGARTADIARELGLHPYAAEKCANATRAFSRRQLIKVLEMLLAADIAQKSGKGEMTELLETAILRICALGR